MPLTYGSPVSAGALYEFDFLSDGIFNPTESELRSRILSAGLPVTSVEVLRGVFSKSLTVRFRWTASGWTVQQVFQNLEAALDNGVGNYSFTSGALIQGAPAGGVSGGDLSNLPVDPLQKNDCDSADKSVVESLLCKVTGINLTWLLVSLGIFAVLIAFSYSYGGSRK